MEGPASRRTWPRRETWLRRAALLAIRGGVLVANLCLGGGQSPPNYSEAARWFLRAAEAGDGAGARALGSLYLVGAGVAQDDEEAARWLRSSAEAGDQASQVDLANLILEGGGRVGRRGCSRRLVQGGGRDRRPRRRLQSGRMLAKGVGVERNDGRRRLAAPRRRGTGGSPTHLRAYARGWARYGEQPHRGARLALESRRRRNAGRGGRPRRNDGEGTRRASRRFQTALARSSKGRRRAVIAARFRAGALYSGSHGVPEG